MRIISLKIYGFGKLQDTTIHLNDGLNIIEGLNEAGKSTIMAFIRSVIFGFESRRNPHLRYEPILGGKFGGAIELKDSSGDRIIIERVFNQKINGDVKVYLQNGEVLGEEYLSILLGKMNQRVFNQIYAFGLDELQQIDSLKDDQINDFIYHAGTGSVNQILKLKQFLEDRQHSLYKPGGKNPEVNSLIQKMDGLKSSIDTLKQEINNHEKVAHQITLLDEEITKLELELEENKKEISWFEKINLYLPSYIRISEITHQLSEFPKEMQFPESGIERLESINEKINELETEKNNLEMKKNRLLLEMEGLQINDLYIELEQRILNIKEEYTNYKHKKEQINNFELKIKQEKEKIKNNIGQLGANFTEDRIEELEITIADKELLHQVSHQIEQKQRLLDDIKKELQLKENRMIKVQGILEEQEKESKRLFNDNSDKIDILYKKVLQNWNTFKEKSWEYNKLGDQLKMLQDQLVFLSSKKISHLSYILILLMLALTGGFFFNHLYFWGIISLLVTLSIFIILQLSRGKKGLDKSIRNNIANIKRQLESLHEEINTIKNRSIQLMEPYGISEFNETTVNQLEQLYDNFYSNKERNLHEYASYQKELKELNSDIRLIKETQYSIVLEELKELKEKWSTWLHQHYIQNDLSQMVVFEILNMVQDTKKSIEVKKEHQSQLDLLYNETKEFEERLNHVIESNDLKQDGSIEEKVFQLYENLRLHKEKKMRFGNLEEKIKELDEDLNRIISRIKIENASINELLTFASVNQIEAYYQKGNLFARYSQLLAELEQLSIHIKAGCDTNNYQKMLADLKYWYNRNLSQGLADLKESLVNQNNKIKKLSEEKGKLQSQLKSLEEDHTLSELNQKYAENQALLQNKIAEYVTVAYTKHLLDKTMKIYEQEKQPNVIKRASDIFAKMTGNKYKKIISPIGSNEIEVISIDDMRFKPQFLSRGTIEQLFLAMRFALVEEFSKQVSLPIILDDIFVNFDTIRLKNALQVLMDLSQKYQILFFTCHSHIASRIATDEHKVHHITI